MLAKLAGPALAQAAKPAAAPAATAAAPAPVYTVKGFRGAVFGMDEAAIRAAAARDFGVAPEALTRQTSPVDGTTSLSLELPKLEPGPGPATVQYVLGARSGTLMHVNVVWTTAETAGAEQREQIVAAGLQLTRYYRSHSWAPRKALAEMPAGPNSVVAFAGQDTAGGIVEVRLDGVVFSRPVDGKVVKSPPPAGPARLRIAYSKSSNPDVATIERGAF